MKPEELASMIDHTLLKPFATPAEITQLCREAVHHRFAAVCVNPAYVSLAARELAGSGVKVCTVVGFPLGANTPEIKAAEARQAVERGAAEIDMVIAIGALKAGDEEGVLRDIRAVVEAAGDKAITKVIIETCFLTDAEKVRACQLAMAAGAHFVKTSTGFGTAGATVEDVRLMRATVGTKMGVKASGGIRAWQQALAMVEAGAVRIGTGSGTAIIEGYIKERRHC